MRDLTSDEYREEWAVWQREDMAKRHADYLQRLAEANLPAEPLPRKFQAILHLPLDQLIAMPREERAELERFYRIVIDLDFDHPAYIPEAERIQREVQELHELKMEEYGMSGEDMRRRGLQ